MQIGELSRRTGVSERLLRYYQARGLLEPDRTAGGHRVYRAEDVVRVANIRALLEAGLTTATIAVVLPCVQNEGLRIVPTCPEMAGHLSAVRERLTTSIADLTRARDAVDALLATPMPN